MTDGGAMGESEIRSIGSGGFYYGDNGLGWGRWAGANRATCDKLGLGEALAAIVLAAGYVVGPACHASHHRAVVPANVGDGRFTPGEGWIGIRAD